MYSLLLSYAFLRTTEPYITKNDGITRQHLLWILPPYFGLIIIIISAPVISLSQVHAVSLLLDVWVSQNNPPLSHTQCTLTKHMHVSVLTRDYSSGPCIYISLKVLILMSIRVTCILLFMNESACANMTCIHWKERINCISLLFVVFSFCSKQTISRLKTPNFLCRWD